MPFGTASDWSRVNRNACLDAERRRATYARSLSRSSVSGKYAKRKNASESQARRGEATKSFMNSPAIRRDFVEARRRQPSPPKPSEKSC